jgi:hypothetical protein
MRIRRLRFTIRLLMFAVVGVFLTPARLVYRWRHYRVLTVMHPIKRSTTSVRRMWLSADRTGWCARQATIAKLQSASVRGSTWERLWTLSGAMAHDLRRLA